MIHTDINRHDSDLYENYFHYQNSRERLYFIILFLIPEAGDNGNASYDIPSYLRRYTPNSYPKI